MGGVGQFSITRRKAKNKETKELSVLILLVFHLIFQTHEDSCQYGDVQCRACGQTMERRYIEQHRTNECINRAISCTYCGQGIQKVYMKVKGRLKF